MWSTLFATIIFNKAKRKIENHLIKQLAATSPQEKIMEYIIPKSWTDSADLKEGHTR